MNKLNKILCGALSATILTVSSIVPVMATEDITVILDGQTLYFDVPPQVINDRTMVPLRAIFEALGASVNWDEGTRTVTSSKDGITISLTVDSSVMYVNGSAVALDSPACIIDGRTLVPVRAISEAYNTDVEWDGDTKTVTILSTKDSEVLDVSPFETLKNYITENSSPFESDDGVTYSIDSSDDYIRDLNVLWILSYNESTDTIEYYGFDTNDDILMNIDIKITADSEPTIEYSYVKAVDAYFYTDGYFDKNTHQLMFDKYVPYAHQELINASLNILLLSHGSLNTGVSLDDLGIWVNPIE